MEQIIFNKRQSLGLPETLGVINKTLVDMFEEACRNYANKPALGCHGDILTFEQVHKKVINLAKHFRKIGIVAGDKVLLMLPNSIQYPVSLFALLYVGATVVNCNPLYTPSEVEYLIKNSEAKSVIVLDLFADKLNSILANTDVKRVIVTNIADFYSVFKKTVINFVIKVVKRTKIDIQYPHIKFSSLLTDLMHEPDPRCKELTPDHVAFIQYTGATTGRPKGAVLLHRNVVYNIHQVFSFAETQIPGCLSSQIVINALPLYHIFSLMANLLVFFCKGSANIMIPNPHDTKSMVKVMLKSKFTVFNALDTLYSKLLSSNIFMQNNYPGFVYSICGGMINRASVMRKWKEKTGVTSTNCYGLTESSPVVSMNVFSDEFNGSVGVPVVDTQVRLYDVETHQQIQEENISGLIYIKGPQVMKEYYKNPEATAQAFNEDGFFKTGDIGMFVDGNLYIQSRETDMIIVSGFNVYPAEIEDVLSGCKLVKESAVVGSPNNVTGEQVNAFVVLADDAKSENPEREIKEYCSGKLAKYKNPRKILVVSSIPKTLVGKPDKKMLATQLAH